MRNSLKKPLNKGHTPVESGYLLGGVGKGVKSPHPFAGLFVVLPVGLGGAHYLGVFVKPLKLFQKANSSLAVLKRQVKHID